MKMCVGLWMCCDMLQFVAGYGRSLGRDKCIHLLGVKDSWQEEDPSCSKTSKGGHGSLLFSLNVLLWACERRKMATN